MPFAFQSSRAKVRPAITKFGKRELARYLYHIFCDDSLCVCRLGLTEAVVDIESCIGFTACGSWAEGGVVGVAAEIWVPCGDGDCASCGSTFGSLGAERARLEAVGGTPSVAESVRELGPVSRRALTNGDTGETADVVAGEFKSAAAISFCILGIASSAAFVDGGATANPVVGCIGVNSGSSGRFSGGGNRTMFDDTVTVSRGCSACFVVGVYALSWCVPRKAPLRLIATAPAHSTTPPASINTDQRKAPDFCEGARSNAICYPTITFANVNKRR